MCLVEIYSQHPQRNARLVVSLPPLSCASRLTCACLNCYFERESNLLWRYVFTLFYGSSLLCMKYQDWLQTTNEFLQTFWCSVPWTYNSWEVNGLFRLCLPDRTLTRPCTPVDFRNEWTMHIGNDSLTTKAQILFICGRMKWDYLGYNKCLLEEHTS